MVSLAGDVLRGEWDSDKPITLWNLNVEPSLADDTIGRGVVGANDKVCGKGLLILILWNEGCLDVGLRAITG